MTKERDTHVTELNRVTSELASVREQLRIAQGVIDRLASERDQLMARIGIKAPSDTECTVLGPGRLRYRCNRAIDHVGNHEIREDNRLVATWPRERGEK